MKRLALLILSLLFLRAGYWLLFREGRKLEMGRTDGYHFTYKGRCYTL